MTAVAPALSLDPDLLADSPPVLPANPSASPAVCNMVMEALLRGLSPEDVAAICKISVSAVEQYASSAWFEKEVAKRAQDGSLQDDTLRSLVRTRAFIGVIRLANLIGSKNEVVALQATKLALDYALKKANDLDVTRHAALPSVEDATREAAMLTKKLSMLRNR